MRLSPTTLLLFDLFLLALLILAARLATALHEVVGHAGVALLCGGDVSAVEVSLFGGGRTHYALPGDAGPLPRFLAAWGGIAVNLLTALPFLWPRRPRARPAWALFGALFAAVSALGAIAYAALGLYYDVGDPVEWMTAPRPAGTWLWAPFLAVAPFASYATAAVYVRVQERVFPAPSLARRIALAAATLGVAGGAYAALYAATSQRLEAADAATTSYARAEAEVRERKREEAVAQARAEHPELSDEEIRRQVEQTPIVVRPEDVPTKFPLAPAIAALYAMGALAALRRVKPADPDATATVSPKAALIAAALAALVLGALALVNGKVY